MGSMLNTISKCSYFIEIFKSMHMVNTPLHLSTSVENRLNQYLPFWPIQMVPNGNKHNKYECTFALKGEKTFFFPFICFH